MNTSSVKTIICVLFISITNIILAENVTKVQFFSGSVEQAQSAAAREGKILIMDFVAGYCGPCRIMEQNTFTDPTLAKYLRENAIIVKVDVESMDGQRHAMAQNVQLLPTILFLNTSKKVVSRYSKIMSAQEIINTVKSNSTYANTKVTEKPATNSKERIGFNTNNNSNTKSTTKTTTPPTSTNNKPSDVYELNVNKISNSGYTIQYNLYQDYTNVIKSVGLLEKKYNVKILVSTTTYKGKEAFRVMIGKFNTKSEADNFRKKNGLEGIVKSLESL